MGNEGERKHGLNPMDEFDPATLSPELQQALRRLRPYAPPIGMEKGRAPEGLREDRKPQGRRG